MTRFVRRSTLALFAIVLVAGVAAYGYVRSAARVAADGELRLPGLVSPVRVLRDELGIPYLFADNLPDLLRAQGFVTAQHRLVQMELIRATWRGELASIVGPAALPSDIRMRVLGLARNGERHAAKLDPEARAFLQAYVDGLNAFVREHPDDHPLELKLVGITPAPWRVEDLATLVHFVHYTHAANIKAEVVAQKLVDHLGPERAREILPLTANPDWPARPVAPKAAVAHPEASAPLGLDWSRLAIASEHEALYLGSNNWAVAPAKSASGRAMLANDPHLDARILPGAWHPIGLFSPEVQAVGAALPGLPGIMVGRTRHVAFGVANAYGDVQDLYVETLDPANASRYLDGGRSVPFDVVTETIRVKDKAAPGGYREETLAIRHTRRGPVVSDHEGLGPKGDKVLALRSTDAEVLAPHLGIEGLLTVNDVGAFDREVQKIDLMMFNFVFADDRGGIGHRATGAVPIRAGADGSLPRRGPTEGGDDWTGFIPKDRMPSALAPARGWVGTANHDTRPEGFPWYYTSYTAPGYRYSRMAQVLDAARDLTVEDHWRLMDDNRNLQSDRLKPAIVAALKDDPTQRDLAVILEQWDGVDRADAAAPFLYQALYREIALGTFADELGKDLALDMLGTWYFWQERFDALVRTPDAPWFDDVVTVEKRETLADVIRAAAPRARAHLVALQGNDPARWRWGKAHTLRLVSPLRRTGAGQELVGGFMVERGGSGETLNRGVYAFAKPYEVNVFGSMRFVVDFGDADKVVALVAGGVSERHFQPHLNDQAKLLMAGEKRHWWFSRDKVEANAKHRVVLKP